MALIAYVTPIPLWILIVAVAMYILLSQKLGFWVDTQLFIRSMFIWLLRRLSAQQALSTLCIEYFLLDQSIEFLIVLSGYWFVVAVVLFSAILPALMARQCKRAVHNDRSVL